MMRRRIAPWMLLTAALTLLWGTEALGQSFAIPGMPMMDVTVQPLGVGTVSGTGVVTVQRQPTVLRVYVELLGRGKTVEEAMADLKKRQEAATAQLDALKADMESIAWGPPSTSNLAAAQQQRFAQMIRARTSSLGRDVPAGLKVPKSYTLSSKLQVGWPLPSGSPEELLVAATVLKEKITEADLGGTKDTSALSPQEREIAEEMAQMMLEYGEEPVPMGEPVFVFVARISEDEHQEALTEAFAKAKAQAERLARAAGQPLGALAGLSSRGSGSDYEELTNNPYSLYDDYSSRQYLTQLVGQDASAMLLGMASNESIGTGVGPVTFYYMVQASFRLNEP